MHEMSIAQSIVDNACAEARRVSSHRVTRVVFRVGVLRQVDSQLLHEAFDAARKGTLCNDAWLSIEQAPLMAVCRDCRESFDALDNDWVCPQCGGPGTDARGGDELELISISAELDDVAGRIARPAPGAPPSIGAFMGANI